MYELGKVATTEQVEIAQQSLTTTILALMYSVHYRWNVLEDDMEGNYESQKMLEGFRSRSIAW
jgi:hypothetical protein